MSAIETRQLFNFIQGSDISGVSSYDIWKSLNPNGTEAEFLEYIRSGPQGEQGPEGPQGSSARVYFLMCSDNVIERTIHDTLLPSSITFNAYYREGTNAAKINYTGRFIIQETTDGYTWTNKYTSNVDESSVNFIPSSTEVKFIKCKLYAAGGTTEELDVQNIPILTDAGLIKVLVATLSNEAHTISCDYNGENCNYEGCNTQVKVYSGVTEVTQSATFNINTSKGVTGAWDENTHVYTITDLSVENGYVDFEITFGGNSIVKRFTVAKIKAGANGEPGSSTYDIWVSSGHEGDVNDFLEFLKGEPGPKGQSTYEVWTGLGNTGTAQEFIESLKGEPGEAGPRGVQGVQGEPGPQGDAGESAYDIWKSMNPDGTEAEFLESIKGKSAYELWLEKEGNEGKTEEEFLKSVAPQADWNQTDENADDYIKNRPFGEEASYEICNTEQSFTFESDNYGTKARASLQRSAYIDYQRINIPTVVVFDGVEYTDLNISENGGDMCIHIEFTTESGDKVIIIENNEILMPYSYVGTTHTIEIKQEYTVVKTIDKKYLPDDVAFKSDIDNKKDKDIIVNISSNNTNEYIADKTFEEITEAYNAGVSLYAMLSGIRFECHKISNVNAWFNYYNPTGMRYYTITIKSDNTVTYTTDVKSAGAYFYGGVIADTKSDTDTVPAKIGEDGKLYVPTYPTLDGLATEEYVNETVNNLGNLKPTNPAVILGTKNNESELPTTENNDGDAYIIGSDLFVWNTDKWTNVGQVRGPQGEQGPEGPQGPKGQSTYDIWKSIEGNEDGTVQDFLNYLKDDGESNVSEETLAQIEKNKNDISQLTEKKVDTPSVATVGQNLKVKAVDENGKPTEWECVNDVQPDYNQNDETAPDYVKNRPFYTKSAKRYSPITDIDIEFEDLGYDNAYVARVDVPYIKESHEFTNIILTIDGTQYEGIGNPWLYGSEENTGESFALILFEYDEDECGIEIYINKELGTSHTISLVYDIAEIIQISSKYIPEVATQIVTDRGMIKWANVLGERNSYEWGIVFDTYDDTGESGSLSVNVPTKYKYVIPTFELDYYTKVLLYPTTIGETITRTETSYGISNLFNKYVYEEFKGTKHFTLKLRTTDADCIPMQYKWVDSLLKAKGLYLDDENKGYVIAINHTGFSDDDYPYPNFTIEVTRIF